MSSLLERYRAAFKEQHYSGIWREIFNQHHRELHKIFMFGSVEESAHLLRNPASNMLHYGFENTIRGVNGASSEDVSMLRQLAEALGVERAPNPEAPTTLRYRFGMWRRDLAQKISDCSGLLERIDRELGARIDFPNVFPGEFGIRTSRGIACYRAIHAVYQASFLHGSVVEIGGGLGRTAYYATRIGVRNYTLVDLPFTALSQGYFLGNALGQHEIRCVPPDAFFEEGMAYDVCLNVDSLTELSQDAAEHYARAIRARCKMFISINHEANEFTIRELFGRPSSRCQYWLRPGYVEERFIFE